MTGIVAAVITLAVAAATARWVWSTPGRPAGPHPAPAPQWARAAGNRALAAAGATAVVASLLSLIAPSWWVWAPPSVAAAAAVALTVTATVSDPTRQVPLVLYPAGWAVAAALIGTRVVSTPATGSVNADPATIRDAVADTVAAGQQAVVVVAVVGAVHTWWVWRSRRDRRARADAARARQISAMRARLDRESATASSPPMKGRRARR